MEETAQPPLALLDRPTRRARTPRPERVLAARLAERGYRLEESIGAGTMGAVYLAEHPLLGRTVAVKLQTRLHPVLTARALREARVLAQACHPNIVQVHDLFRVGEGLAVVMEYCTGGTLGARLREEGRVPFAEALAIARQAALALAHVHGLGYAHRDVKPENFFLCEGAVKLGDFGLVCSIRAEATDEDLGGTPYYMAPEAWQGVATPRTDLHSLGVALFEMISGRRPFAGDSSREVMERRLAGGPCPVEEIARLAPPAVTDLVASLLAFAPEDRPASAEEAAARMAQLTVDSCQLTVDS